jgi:DNA-binding NarL/FixJ family response regulator
MAPIPEENRTAKNLAIMGALLTGAAGVGMAGYSVMAGEETGAGALLAASALAFGLLARTLATRFSPSAPQEMQTNGASVDRWSVLPQLEVGGALDRATRDHALEDREPVTGRELEVLSLVAEGYSNKRISAALRISERTVKSHLTVTMGKLRASDRTHAVVTAYRHGWLTL